MQESVITVGVGGVVIASSRTLLVRTNYGEHLSKWTIPGGFVEPGESLENAIVREITEETSICTRPVRLVGIRSGVRQMSGGMETTLYIVFECEYLSGEPTADNHEVSRAEFREINEVLEDQEVMMLTKEMIRSTVKIGGLNPINRASESKGYAHFQPYVIG